MTGAGLYLTSRRVPGALAVALGAVAATSLLWWCGADEPDVGIHLVVLAVLFMVSAGAGTLAPADVALERTAARRWVPLRSAHLLAVVVLVAGVLAATAAAPVRIGPVGLVVRDAAGLVGLAALGAAAAGGHRGWFLPVAWTLPAVVLAAPDSVPGRVLTWQMRDPGDLAAGTVAAGLAVAGAIAYCRWGPARRSDAEPGVR